MAELVPKCNKCNRVFKSFTNLIKHQNKKIPCDLKHECLRCGYVFRDKDRLTRHMNRKTPCELIQGNPMEPMENPNTCRYCYKSYTYKHNLTRHYKKCKIKNGGMEVLLKKMEEQQKEINILKNQINNIPENKQNHDNKNSPNNKQINNGTINNDNSTHVNIMINTKQLMNFGTNNMEEKAEELLGANMKQILYSPITSTGKSKKDIENKETIERVAKLVKSVFRNPKAPEMQNIVTSGSKEYLEDWDAPEPKTACWNENKWNFVRLHKVGKYISQIFNDGFGDIKNKKDVCKIKKKFNIAVNADPDRVRKENEPKNNFFNDRIDPRDEIDMLFVYIALALDRDGLLDIPEKIGKKGLIK